MTSPQSPASRESDPVMRTGPFHTVAHCTFCGTSDVYVFPGPREANVAYWQQREKPMPADICHFETHATYCVACCEVQEGGHEYEYQQSEGHRCKYCDAEPPHDWYRYDY